MHLLKAGGTHSLCSRDPHPGSAFLSECIYSQLEPKQAILKEHFSNNPAEYFSCCLASPAAVAGAHREAGSPVLALQTAGEIQILHEIALQRSIIQPEELWGQMGAQASHGRFKYMIVPYWTLANTLITFQCFNGEFRKLFGFFPITYCNLQGSQSPP